MPGAAKPSVFETIRSSCAAACEGQQHVAIDEAAITALAQSLDVASVRCASQGAAFPVRFQTVEEEVSFLALYHLLDFGSGYDDLLLQKNKRDARETIQFGLLGIVIGGKRLEAPWMKAFSMLDVSSCFGVEGMEDSEVPNLPGVTMSRPGPLQPFAQALRGAVNEAGAVLEDNESRSLGAHICEFLEDCRSGGRSPTASALAAELADSFPGFRDEALVGGAKVTYLRKAQSLAADLHRRFGGKDPRFAFPDISELTSDSNAMLAAVLRHHGVLKLEPELAAAIDEGREVEAGAPERLLRAASAVAVDRLAAALASAAGSAEGSAGVTARQVSDYLLGEGEGPLKGQVKPHLTKGIVSY